MSVMTLIPKRVIGTQYEMPINMDVFDMILGHDLTCEKEYNKLCNRMEMIQGIWGVEYNMYMGDSIFLTIDHEHDIPETWETIGSMIAEYVGDGYVS